ncbi:hypothetical protein [Sphingomonas sp. GC_Shp_3]|uniref:hypothetical protein n=1 Tax=Sphingomonas sp. GC_Shp_3 TaxID=2937383 RepID=UPI002269AAA4|nr:hypothetical protein [Sphingomonas sp. GC_Shp_3]
MSDVDLLPGRLLRQLELIKRDAYFRGGQIDDPELAEVLSPDAPLLVLHEATIRAEGSAWQASHGRLLFSKVPNRRLNAWYEDDGRVEGLDRRDLVPRTITLSRLMAWSRAVTVSAAPPHI